MTKKERNKVIKKASADLGRHLFREAVMMASDFKGGLSVEGVKNKYAMKRWVVEQAIRVVMKEEAA